MSEYEEVVSELRYLRDEIHVLHSKIKSLKAKVGPIKSVVDRHECMIQSIKKRKSQQKQKEAVQ